jgi:hypothetical protein
MSTPLWRLTEREWRALGAILAPASRPARGRRRLDNARQVAEACLYRHFNSHSKKFRAFGWNDLPEELGVSPSTANRRYREWQATGAWLRFWAGLQELRAAPERASAARGSSRGTFPAGDILGELERAYRFFNTRFFGGALPRGVAILVGGDGRDAAGDYCSRRWHRGERALGQIRIGARVLCGTPIPALTTLLHEMVHLRNDQVGLPDCDPRNQYHNRHFRDLAHLSGLRCGERQANRGYQATELDERGLAAVRDLEPDLNAFAWRVS